jgi:AcrR family transcriptional regulator
MTITRKKPGRPPVEGLQDRRREEILDVASRLFARHGYPDTDVDSVAAELGVAKGTVYRYFPSKRDLFLAAVDRGVARLNEFVCARAEELADPLEMIAAAIETFLEYFESHPELVELFIQERAHFGERAKPAYFAAYDQNHEARQAFLAGLIADGRLRPWPGAPDFDVVNDLMFGTVLANQFTGRQVPAKEQARRIVDVIYHGILTDEERRRRKEEEQ